MTAVYTVTLALLSLAGILALARLLRGPTTLDRVLCLDIFAILLVAGIAVGDAMHGTNEHVAIMAAVALLGFTGTVTAARLVWSQG